MISFYILSVLVFPAAALWNVKVNAGKPVGILLGREDTLYLRGLAACMVVLAHFCAWLNEAGCGINKIVAFALNQFGGIGVLIFFFASGYGIYEKYAKKRADYGYLIIRGGGYMYRI